MVRARISEKLAMEISGHKTRNVFERYNISDERDLREAGEKINTYLQEQPRKAKVVTRNLQKVLISAGNLPASSFKRAV